MLCVRDADKNEDCVWTQKQGKALKSNDSHQIQDHFCKPLVCRLPHGAEGDAIGKTHKSQRAPLPVPALCTAELGKKSRVFIDKG